MSLKITYNFQISATSPRGQWVHVRPCQDWLKFLLSLFMKIQSTKLTVSWWLHAIPTLMTVAHAITCTRTSNSPEVRSESQTRGATNERNIISYTTMQHIIIVFSCKIIISKSHNFTCDQNYEAKFSANGQNYVKWASWCLSYWQLNCLFT